jgi:Protein of unknown function (DUF2971)
MATVKSYVQPERLYRYRPIADLDREISAIADGYLYCAAYTDLNDPMEGLFSSSELLRKSENYRRIKSAITENKANIGMCSFSEVHDHELMWAHYAERFAGICIAYSLSKLLKSLPEDVSFVRMYYNEKVPKVSRTDHGPSHLAKTILSYKNYKWLYEREWRMFAPLGRAHYHKTACVTRVYFGSRIDLEKKAQIKRAMEDLRIATREMNIGQYSLSFRASS